MIFKGQHILMSKDKTCWHFLYDTSRRGIIFRKGKKGRFSEYELLTGEITSDFSVAIDENDTLHIIGGGINGDVIYYCCNNNIWQRFVLVDRVFDAEASGFNIIISEGTLNLFYTAKKNGKSRLIQQLLNRESEPVIIDTLSEEHKGVYEIADDSGNIYIFYSNEMNVLGYRVYVWSEKAVTEFFEVAQNAKMPNAIIDDEDAIHITYIKNNSIIYNKICSHITVEEIGYEDISFKYAANPLIFFHNKSISVIWHVNMKTICVGDMSGNMRKHYIGGSLSVIRLDTSNRNKFCYGYGLSGKLSFFMLLEEDVFSPKEETELFEPSIKGEEVEKYAAKHVNKWTKPRTDIPFELECIRSMLEVTKLELDEVKNLLTAMNNSLNAQMEEEAVD